jgi:hypothetical protein
MNRPLLETSRGFIDFGIKAALCGCHADRLRLSSGDPVTGAIEWRPA